MVSSSMTLSSHSNGISTELSASPSHGLPNVYLEHRTEHRKTAAPLYLYRRGGSSFHDYGIEQQATATAVIHELRQYITSEFNLYVDSMLADSYESYQNDRNAIDLLIRPICDSLNNLEALAASALPIETSTCPIDSFDWDGHWAEIKNIIAPMEPP